MERIRIVLGFKSWANAQAVEEVLKGNPEFQIIATPTTATGVYDEATTMGANVVLFESTLPGFQTDLISELLHYDEFPIACIGLLPPLESRVDEMYALGLKGHISMPLDPAQARRLLELIPEAAARVQVERQDASYVPLDGQALARLGAAADSWQRMTIALWGTGGGVGKTSLAINIAAALGVLAQRKTLLLDLDMTRGALAPRLGLQIDKNIFALFNQLLPDYIRTKQVRCTPAMLRNFAQPWGSSKGSKLSCLAGIPRMSAAGKPVFREDPERTMAFTQAILQTANRQYDFVIVDLGPDVNNSVHYAALEAADLVLTVARPDLADIYSTHDIIPELQNAFGKDVGKFELVVNQWYDAAGIKMRDMIDEIGMKKFAAIPYDPEYSYAGNQQRPFVLEKPNPTSDTIVAMASRFYPVLASIWTQRGGNIEGEQRAFRNTERRQEPGIRSRLLTMFMRGG